MGYNADSIRNLDRLIELGVLSSGSAVLEFGSQEAIDDPIAIRSAIEHLAGVLDIPVSLDVRSPMPMREVFSAIGLKHASIDVNGLHESIFFDLNTQTVPAELCGKFQWVNNEGTTEHVCNQLNALRAAHDFCAKGGYISHSVPMMGWVDHGLVNCTPKFWCCLIEENHYELVEAHYFVSEGLRQLPEPYRWPGGDFTYPDVWLHLLLRKKSNAPFSVPLDHLETDSYGDLARQLRGVGPVSRITRGISARFKNKAFNMARSVLPRVVRQAIRRAIGAISS